MQQRRQQKAVQMNLVAAHSASGKATAAARPSSRSQGVHINKFCWTRRRVHPVALLIHRQRRVQPERACGDEAGAQHVRQGLRQLARGRTQAAAPEPGPHTWLAPAQHACKRRPAWRAQPGPAGAAGGTHHQTWRGQVAQAKPLVSGIPDAVKHGVSNCEVLPFCVIALSHHAPAARGSAGGSRAAAGWQPERRRRRAVGHAQPHGGPPGHASRAQGCASAQGAIPTTISSPSPGPARPPASASAPHARRLGCRQPDAAVLNHHTAGGVNAQLLPRAARRQGAVR